MRVAVVGTGLSSLAAIRALIRRGVTPVVIDAGGELDSGLRTVVGRMAAQAPGDWARDDVELIRRNPTLQGSGIPRKLVFGSDYIYARGQPLAGLGGEGVKASMSLAKGGFGNAWGAAVLPADPADLAPDWPAAAARLDAHYRAVLSWLPLSAGDDRLARDFPTFSDTVLPLDMPEQAAAFQRALSARETPELSHGLARLAVHADGPRACRKCGLCLSGCVYGSIFNPTDEIERLVREQRIDYRPGLLVERLSERNGRVALQASRIGDQAGKVLEFDRLFLGAGAISSTRIMLSSLDAYDEPVTLRDSQKFLLPLLRLRGARYETDQTHTLAAMFVETRIPELGGNWMHMQVSAIGDFVLRRLGADRSVVLHAALRPFLQRMLIAWGSLHSAHSGALEVRLRRGEGVDGARLVARELGVAEAHASVRTALRRFAGLVRRTGTFVIPQLVQYSAVGSGNHLGGSFPMRASPAGRFDSDVLGRPHGWRNVHLIDAAVLPSIPATTIALLMMATADRIATEAPLG